MPPRRSGHQAHLDRADADCIAFEQTYKGKLAAMAASADGGAALAAAGKNSTKRSTPHGAGSAPTRGSFMPVTPSIRRGRNSTGDIQERMTAASTHLLCLRRSNSIASTMPFWKPRWPIPRSAITGRGGRRPPFRPYQLEDRVEQLFHEKSVTAYSAWNRQFDRQSPICVSRWPANRSPSADAQSHGGSFGCEA